MSAWAEAPAFATVSSREASHLLLAQIGPSQLLIDATSYFPARLETSWLILSGTSFSGRAVKLTLMPVCLVKLAAVSFCRSSIWGLFTISTFTDLPPLPLPPPAPAQPDARTTTTATAPTPRTRLGNAIRDLSLFSDTGRSHRKPRGTGGRPGRSRWPGVIGLPAAHLESGVSFFLRPGFSLGRGGCQGLGGIDIPREPN